jgi:hypothetical protein
LCTAYDLSGPAGRESGVDPLTMRRWITGMWKLDVHDDGSWVLRTPSVGEQGNAQLLEYHELLITQLRAREDEAAQAANDLAKAGDTSTNAAILLHEAEQAASAAETAGDAAAAELEARRIEAGVAADAASNAYAVQAVKVQDLMHRAAEWHDFIREPLRRTREEIRTRGMLLPDLPADIALGEDDG